MSFSYAKQKYISQQIFLFIYCILLEKKYLADPIHAKIRIIKLANMLKPINLHSNE